jgi:hypothetical protein
MRAGAASGESFGADFEMQPSFIPAYFIPAQCGMARKPLFSYDVAQSPMIRIEAPCEYRAFSAKCREK